MTIQAGDRIPDGKLKIMGADGPVNVTAAELLGKGRVVLFSVPGAFTPTCDAKHLPGFVDQAPALKAKGVAKIVCMAVNDVFVMNAWGKSAGVGQAIVMAADGNGDYARALGLELDARGFGARGGAGRVQGLERRARPRVALGRAVIAGPVSFLYAGLLGLLLIALSTQVVLARRRYRVRLGTGTEEGMQQAVRVQANFVEYVPFAVLLLVLAELTGLPGPAVHGAGLLLLASRVLHAVGLSRSPGVSFGRFYGTAGTWLTIVALSVWLLYATTAVSRSPAPG
jgi:peroxiredoxin/uncharacterized membrane protein YecN with MAPEG domain